MRSVFLGCSSYLPSSILTNFDLEKIVDTTNEWITQRTGIEKRHIAKQESVAEMAALASLVLLKNTNIDPKKIDLIVISSTTSEKNFPSLACCVQQKIGAKNAMCFTIQEACSGFIYSTTIADKFLKSGSHKMALVIGAEKMSSIVDWTDRNTCVLFGDGAGAMLLSADNQDNNLQNGIIDTLCFSDGTLGNILYADMQSKVQMNGKEVFRHAVTNMTDLIKTILNKNNLTISDVAAIVPHQANARILSAVAKNINCPEEKFISVVGQHGNTSSASIPLALDYAIQHGKIKKDDLVIMESVGAGLTWGAVLMRL